MADEAKGPRGFDPSWIWCHVLVRSPLDRSATQSGSGEGCFWMYYYRYMCLYDGKPHQFDLLQEFDLLHRIADTVNIYWIQIISVIHLRTFHRLHILIYTLVSGWKINVLPLFYNFLKLLLSEKVFEFEYIQDYNSLFAQTLSMFHLVGTLCVQVCIGRFQFSPTQILCMWRI